MTVINGAIGKSPAIDKLNCLPAANHQEKIVKEMEHIICNGENGKYQPVSISFDRCIKELQKQIKK